MEHKCRTRPRDKNYKVITFKGKWFVHYVDYSEEHGFPCWIQANYCPFCGEKLRGKKK